MKKEEKNQVIEELAEVLKANKNLYITDISELNVEKTNELRRLCFKRDVQLRVVKNTLLRKAMEHTEKPYEPLFDILNGPTAIMLCESPNEPAKLIKDFRKKGVTKPVLKGALIDESIFIGHDQLDALVSLKTKNELLGEIIGLLQSPLNNVMGALQSGGHTISGLVKTLSERPE
jgi:large subunit ribosomal protein L10